MFAEHEAIWLFIFGQLVMFFCWLLGGGYYMGKILSRFDNALSRLGAVEERAARIDERGTIYSQFNVKSEVEKIEDIVRRVGKLEMNARKLDVVEERVKAIATHLKVAET